jgi:hypothetical protein
MADARAKTLSELDQINAVSNAALMLVSDFSESVNGVASFAVPIVQLFQNMPGGITLPSGYVLTGQVVGSNVSANIANFENLYVNIQPTPANSSIAIAQGGIFSDGTYLYVAVANNQLMRVPLQSF